MAITHCKDFFAPEHAADHRAFGFTGSAPAGRARNHPMDPAGEEDPGTYVERQQRRNGGRVRRASGGPAIEPGSTEDFWTRDDTGAPGEIGVVAKDAAGKTDWPETERISANNYDDSLREKYPSSLDKPARKGGKPMFTDKSEFGSPPQAKARGGRVKGYQFGGMVDGAPSGRPEASMPPQGQPTGALSRATISLPAIDAMQTMGKVAQAGKAAGARQAVNAIANAARLRRAAPQAMPAAQTATAATPMPAPAQQGIPGMKHGGPLSAKQRHALPASSFALPGERYPINDPNHARNALARVSQHGSPEEKSRVRAAVHRRYPGIGEKG